MKRFFRWYASTSLLVRILACFFIGAVVGGALWAVSRYTVGPGAVAPGIEVAVGYIEPFGAVFVGMLKMIVVPVIFFSLITGAASLPIKRFGRIGTKVIAWYLLCSLLAAVVGVCLATLIDPGSGVSQDGWTELAAGREAAVEGAVTGAKSGREAFTALLLSMFETANNVTGDLVCTYAVAKREGLVEPGSETETAT